MVVSTCDGLPELEEQVRSIAAQVVDRPWRVVFVDDASRDGTAEFLATAVADLPHAELVERDRRGGKARALNEHLVGVGDVHLVLLDQDDVLAPGYLAAMAQALDERSFVAATADIDHLNAPVVADALRHLPDLATASVTLGGPEPVTVPVALGGALGVRSRALVEMGPLDPDVGACADVDMCIRLAAAGHALVRVPEAVLHYRLRASLRALARQRAGYGAGWEALFAKYRDRGLRSEPVGAALVAALRACASPDRARRIEGVARASFLVGRARARRPGRRAPARSATADDVGLVLVEPGAGSAAGHFMDAVAVLGAEADRRSIGATVVVPSGAVDDVADRLRGRAGVSTPRSGAPAARALEGLARATATGFRLGNRVVPRSAVPYQWLHVSRSLWEAAALRAGRAGGVAVVLTSNESLLGFTAVVSGRAHVRVVHDVTNHEGRVVRTLERMAVRGRDHVAVVATTPSVAADVTARFPDLDVAVQPFAVVEPDPVSPAERVDARRHLGFGDEPWVVLMGGWWPPKDAATVVEAIGRLDGEVGLLVAGDPLDDAVLDRLRRRPRARLHVIDRPVTAEERRRCYAAADATVVARTAGATKESGLVADAVRFAVPLVVTDHDPAVAEVLRPLPWATVVPAGDAAALAVALRDVATGPGDRPDAAAGAALGFPTAAQLLDRYLALGRSLRPLGDR